MTRYYVNKQAQSTGEHEVHAQSCWKLPASHNLLALGLFSSCAPTVQEAANYYASVDGCYHCSRACHSR
jgi:hypothetical protein